MNLFGDLQDVRLMYLKGGLFLVLGVMAGASLLVESPTMQVKACASQTVLGTR